MEGARSYVALHRGAASGPEVFGKCTSQPRLVCASSCWDGVGLEDEGKI